MKKDFDKILESGEKFNFGNTNYSDSKIKKYLGEVVDEQEKVIREAKCTIYEISQICFPQFHPFYRK